jgi:hypothetical protein
VQKGEKTVRTKDFKVRFCQIYHFGQVLELACFFKRPKINGPELGKVRKYRGSQPTSGISQPDQGLATPNLIDQK